MQYRIVLATFATAGLLVLPAGAAPVKKAAAKTAQGVETGGKAVGHGAMTVKRKTVKGAKAFGKQVKRVLGP